MEREKFINYCQAIESGIKRSVSNGKTHEVGRVVACRHEYFEVEVDGERKNWSCQECEDCEVRE